MNDLAGARRLLADVVILDIPVRRHMGWRLAIAFEVGTNRFESPNKQMASARNETRLQLERSSDRLPNGDSSAVNCGPPCMGLQPDTNRSRRSRPLLSLDPRTEQILWSADSRMENRKGPKTFIVRKPTTAGVHPNPFSASSVRELSNRE